MKRLKRRINWFSIQTQLSNFYHEFTTDRTSFLIGFIAGAIPFLTSIMSVLGVKAETLSYYPVSYEINVFIILVLFLTLLVFIITLLWILAYTAWVFGFISGFISTAMDLLIADLSLEIHVSLYVIYNLPLMMVITTAFFRRDSIFFAISLLLIFLCNYLLGAKSAKHLSWAMKQSRD